MQHCNDLIDKVYTDYCHLDFDNKFELCKNDIIEWSQKRSKQIARDRKKEFVQLVDKMEELEAQPLPLAEIREQINYIETSKKLELNVQEQVQSAAFHSRCQYQRDYERNSKFFFSLEKKNYNTKTMRLLQNEKGQFITNSKHILEEQRKFYENLYKKDDSISFKLENKSGIQLSEIDKEKLDQPITYLELTEAVKLLKPNKVAGCDGLSAEWYQFFWTKIGPMYYDAIKYAFTTQRLHLSAQRGLITLIPKGHKNLQFLVNWHPLTMLTTDYKILAKALATRIKTVLPYIIAESQCGFMEERQISLTLRTTIDISKLSKNVKGYLLTLDFQKCFDRIEYNAITGAMKYFNFGNNYIQWTKLLLNGFQSCNSNNGMTSSFFDVTRSCHQGCPATPYYYLLCGEVMAHKIKENSNIRGIQLNQLEHIISQFADDTQLFLDSKKSVEHAIKPSKALSETLASKLTMKKQVFIV